MKDKEIPKVIRVATPVPWSRVAEVGRRKPVDVEGAVAVWPEEVAGAKPKKTVAGVAQSSNMDLDLDSGSSECVSARTKRLWRRRTRAVDHVATSDTDEPVSKSLATESRGRGRSPSVGGGVGLRKGPREQARQKAEAELAEQLRFIKSPVPAELTDVDDHRPVLKEDLRTCGQIVKTIVKKSGHLKGTCQRALNRVTNTLLKYVDQPESATMARLEEEVKHWKENSARLEAAMAQIQKENDSLRHRLESLEAVANKRTEELVAIIDAKWQARLESVAMGPASRPPLAHEHPRTKGDVALPVQGEDGEGAPKPNLIKGKSKDKGKGKGKSATQSIPQAPARTMDVNISRPDDVISRPGPSGIHVPVAKQVPQGGRHTLAPTPIPALEQLPVPPSRSAAPKKGKRKKALQAPTVVSVPEPRPMPPAPESMGSEWTVVAGKRRKPKSGVAPAANQQKQPRRTEPKLRPPRSAAVIISMAPEAAARGLTYAKVLTEAQGKVSLAGLDISRLKPKFAATGAPMYEVPGANSEERADSLAQRLRECFAGSSDIRVTRPTKTAELRLSELDYTATPESVAVALSRAGECAMEAIKVGLIRPDRSGLGTVWVRMPIKAAQKVRGAGRILIGWVAARVTVLESRPLRCYRCLENGHVRERCDCAVDRSGLCYRCGQEGHKARDCESVPYCTVCAASGRPAGHQVGGKACTAPSRRKQRRSPRIPAAAAEAMAQPQVVSPPQVAAMDVVEESTQ